MRIEVMFDGDNPNECVESVWVRVGEKEHCLDWDESQYSAGETYGKGVYLDGVYANNRLDFLRNAKVMVVKTVDISLEEYISDVNLMPKIDATSKSLLKKGIGYYCKTKNVAKTALSGGYNSMVRAEAMDVLLNQINL